MLFSLLWNIDGLRNPNAVAVPMSLRAVSRYECLAPSGHVLAAHPQRCVIGHPFNPPHIIPLVEVVGGAKTSPETIEQAMAFYQRTHRNQWRVAIVAPIVGENSNGIRRAWRSFQASNRRSASANT